MITPTPYAPIWRAGISSSHCWRASNDPFLEYTIRPTINGFSVHGCERGHNYFITNTRTLAEAKSAALRDARDTSS